MFPTFNRLFVLTFPNEEDRNSFSKYYTPTVEIKDYNVILDGEPFYAIPIKNNQETYKAITELIRNDLLGTGNEFNFEYFCKHYKLIVIDLSKQINFIGKLEKDATIFFITEEKSQKIINLLDHKDEDDPRFETKKWYIVNDINNGNYSGGDGVQSIVKFNTEIVEPFLCDNSDAYILVTGDIKVAAADKNTRVAIKNCHPFTRAFCKLNDEQVDTAYNLVLTMGLYNMFEYSDNYADTTASLYQYKRPEPSRSNDGDLIALDNTSSSFKYLSGLI